MKAKNAAFNWSDEELLSDLTQIDKANIIVKGKYDKKNKTTLQAI